VVDHYFFKLSFQPAGTIFWMFVGLSLAATRLATLSTDGANTIDMRLNETAV